MTLQQLEYILAVEQYRHFAKAAEHCRVTQPTLSAMIQKHEDELDTRIFDRSRQPIAPTPIGLHILAQAREVLAQAARIKAMVEEAKGSFTGTFNLGILPTIAPYLLPRLLALKGEEDGSRLFEGREGRTFSYDGSGREAAGPEKAE